jgi:hypothetical protein
MTLSGGSIRVMHPLFQEGEGGSIPTPPLSAKELTVEVVTFDEAVRLNRIWHSRLPKMTDRIVRVCYAACCKGGIAYAVAIWSHPVARLLPQHTWLELRRLAVAPDAPKNTASRMLRVMTDLIGKSWPEVERAISYQDTEVHKGTIYAAAGWRVVDVKGSQTKWGCPSRPRRASQSEARKRRWEKDI